MTDTHHTREYYLDAISSLEDKAILELFATSIGSFIYSLLSLELTTIKVIIKNNSDFKKWKEKSRDSRKRILNSISLRKYSHSRL